MNHFLYPLAREPREATARFGNVAVKALFRLLIEEGSREKDLEAQIFGGACLSDSPRETMEISEKNVLIGREVLVRNKIPIVSEDVGGSKGRKLVYNTLTNEVVVLRVERLRDGDWYPYTEKR